MILRKKKLLVGFWCFLHLFASSRTEERTILDDIFLPTLRVLRLNILKDSIATFATKSNERKLKQLEVVQDEVDASVPFPCALDGNIRSVRRPVSVHKLQPGDVDVVAAMGDSLTAGTALSASTVSLRAILYEDRGKSFSGGGQDTWRTMITLPNILKVFNPNLIGFSLGPSLTIQKASQFNVAENGAISDNMPYMAKVLVQRIKNDRRVNLDQDWKLISLMIGDNDFCSEICYTKRTAEDVLSKHRTDLIQSLRILRDNLPKTYVNLIPPPSIEALVNVKSIPAFHKYFLRNVQCPCLFGLQYRHLRSQFYDLMKKWQNVDIEVSKYVEFDRDDFTVVAQPLFVKSSIPEEKSSTYLAVDYFHFSRKGAASVANSLWNNMLEPVGNKTEQFTKPFQVFKCPTNEFRYFYTNRNSKN